MILRLWNTYFMGPINSKTGTLETMLNVRISTNKIAFKRLQTLPILNSKNSLEIKKYERTQN